MCRRRGPRGGRRNRRRLPRQLIQWRDPPRRGRDLGRRLHDGTPWRRLLFLWHRWGSFLRRRRRRAVCQIRRGHPHRRSWRLCPRWYRRSTADASTNHWSKALYLLRRPRRFSNPLLDQVGSRRNVIEVCHLVRRQQADHRDDPRASYSSHSRRELQGDRRHILRGHDRRRHKGAI